MNQKKCPKCGENNPVEAVMCWACYTPLSASAAAGGGTTAGGPPAAAANRGGDSGKKPVAPWQIGVIAVALLVLAGGGFMAMQGSSDTGPYGSGTEVPVVGPPSGGPPVPPMGGNGSAPPPPELQPNAPSASTPNAGPPYTVTTSPSPNSSVGTVGIVPKQAVGEQQGAVLAASLGKRMRGGPWQSIHIYVFADVQTANNFNQFQRNNGDGALGPQDYQQLQTVWSNTLARYEISGGKDSVRYPKRSPNGWWR